MTKLSIETKRRKQEKTGNFTIGSILNRKIENNQKYYYVKWRDYPKSYNSWEPYYNLRQAWDIIKDFDRKYDRKSRRSKEKLVKSKPEKQEKQEKQGKEGKEKEIESLYNDFLNSIDKETTVLPSQILKMDVKFDGKMNVVVKYNNSDVKIEDYDCFKTRFPQIVLDFYEKRIVFPFDNAGTRKFHMKFNKYDRSSNAYSEDMDIYRSDMRNNQGQ